MIHRLPRDPIHLWQHNPAAGAYRNPLGCGAFTTAMALSVYDPAYGTYGTARAFFAQMGQVPVFGGTFEGENAAVARRAGFLAHSYDHGTVADLAAAVDLGAPAILLVDPLPVLGTGMHDVLLVGYSVDGRGPYLRLFVDNPAIERPTQPAPPGLNYLGNETLAITDLPGKWTGVFTPVFATPEQEARWRTRTGR